MKTLLALLIPLALAACGGGVDAGNTQAPSVAATPPPAGRDWTQVVAKTAEGYVMGNPNAPIKLVEYGSRLCPTCGALANEGYRPLTENYVKTGKVSFEFREFLVHGPPDMPAALLGQCVGTDAFFPLLEQMFAEQRTFTDKWQAIPAAEQQRIQAAPPADAFRMWGEQLGLIDFVKARGLPEPQARACIANKAEVDRLAKQTQAKGPGGDGTVTGTPTMLINGTVAQGVITWGALEQALRRAGA